MLFGSWLARTNGMSPTVLQLRDDIVEWQRENDCMRPPSMEEQRLLAQRIQNYLEQEKQARVAAMRQAFPSDVPSAQALQLDCLVSSEAMEAGVNEMAIGLGTRSGAVHRLVARGLCATAIFCTVDRFAFLR